MKPERTEFGKIGATVVAKDAAVGVALTVHPPGARASGGTIDTPGVSTLIWKSLMFETLG